MNFILECERQAVLENDVSGWCHHFHIIHSYDIDYICPDMEVCIFNGRPWTDSDGYSLLLLFFF